MSSPRYTLRQLEIFLAVARTNSVTHAADILHLSPSATSAAITELERSIGTTLCIRRKARGVRLTAEGRLLERRATQLLNEAVDISNSLAEAKSGELHGTVRLGCYSPLSASFLPTLLEEFAKRFPAVDIELIERHEDNLHDMMLDGYVDVAIGYEQPAHPELESIHLASRRPHVIVSRGHRLDHSASVDLSDLAEEPLILLDVIPSKSRILSWFDAAGVTPRVRMITHDVDLTRSLVGRGLGYAVLMQRQHHDLSLDGYSFHTMEIDSPVDPVDVYLVVPRASMRTRRIRAFLDLARETPLHLPPWVGVLAEEKDIT